MNGYGAVMGGCKVGAPHPGVLPIWCTALLLLSQAATCFRLLDSNIFRQPLHHDGRQGSRFLRPFRQLAETEEAGKEAEDIALQSLKRKQLGGGINRLGIHGEGLTIAHALLESDAEVMALAAAMKSGQAFAEGRGNDKVDSMAEGGEEGEAGSPGGENAPRKVGRLERVAEKLEEAARAAHATVDGSDAGRPQDAPPAAAEEPDQAAAAPEQAAETATAGAKEKPAAATEAAEALPPWFSRKTASAASEAGSRSTEQSHGAGRHSSRRSRHHNRCQNSLKHL